VVAQENNEMMNDKTTRQINLLGQPTLQGYLDFVQNMVVDGDSVSKTDLVDGWRQANDHYQSLEESEAQLADDVELFKLPPELQSLIPESMEDSRYKFTFDKLPTCFAMVELDRMVIYQNHINLEFSESLQSTLGSNPEPERLFRFCMPPDSPDDTVQIRRMGSERFVFSSQSTDFRAHEPTLLQPDQVSDFNTFGPVSGMVGLAVGFGSNYLTAIRVDDRILLHNGYHRAHALRALGITHAPCIVQTATRLDELEIAARSIVLKDPDFYFGAARPPLLKDFFDPEICREFTVFKMQKMIEVNFSINSYQVRM